LISEWGERRFRIHRRDQPKEAEHPSPGLKKTGLMDPIKRAVSSQQLSGPFWPDSSGARQFVRRVTAERDEVRYSLWINAITLPHLLGPDAREFTAPRRVQNRCVRRGELKGISITAGYYGSAACALLSGDCGGEKVVRLEPWGFGGCKPKGGDKLGQNI
jgi:hypothetical protein